MRVLLKSSLLFKPRIYLNFVNKSIVKMLFRVEVDAIDESDICTPLSRDFSI